MYLTIRDLTEERRKDRDRENARRETDRQRRKRDRQTETEERQKESQRETRQGETMILFINFDQFINQFYIFV